MYKFGIKSGYLFQEKNGVPTIGISGNSGSGKTTISSNLMELFGKENTTIIYGDDVHKWERGDDNWNNFTHLNPISNRLHQHYNDIKKLKYSGKIFRSHYDHSTGKFTNKIEIKSSPFSSVRPSPDSIKIFSLLLLPKKYLSYPLTSTRAPTKLAFHLILQCLRNPPT